MCGDGRDSVNPVTTNGRPMKKRKPLKNLIELSLLRNFPVVWDGIYCPGIGGMHFVSGVVQEHKTDKELVLDLMEVMNNNGYFKNNALTCEKAQYLLKKHKISRENFLKNRLARFSDENIYLRREYFKMRAIINEANKTKGNKPLQTNSGTKADTGPVPCNMAE